jgi:thioredoxin 1
MKRFTTFMALAAAVGVAGVAWLSGCANLGHDENSVHYGTNVIKLTVGNFQQEVLASTKPVLVDFWAPWCGPCRAMVPTISALADEYQDRVVFGSVNVDDETALSEKFNIEGIPAVFIFKDGKPVQQLIGLREKQELRDALNQVLTGQVTAVTAP